MLVAFWLLLKTEHMGKPWNNESAEKWWACGRHVRQKELAPSAKVRRTTPEVVRAPPRHLLVRRRCCASKRACTVTQKKTEKNRKNGKDHDRQSTPKRNVFAITPPVKTLMRDYVEELELQVDTYKRLNSRLKLLANWNVRATQSALKNSQDILELVEDLYGDNAFEEKKSLLD